MHEADAMAVVKALYEALARRDIGAVEALADPEIEILDPDLPGGGHFHGSAGARRLAEQWLDAFEELEIEVERLVPVDGRVVACIHQRGRSRAGVPVEFRDGHVWTVKAGKLTRAEMYMTHEAALAAAADDR